MHLSNLVLLPLALLPLVTADSDSGEGSWSIRGSKSKDKPDLYDDLASGRNTVVCEELSNGEELSFVKGTPGDFVVTVYEGLDNDDNKKCLGEGANIQPGKVYEGPWKHYEVSPFSSSSLLFLCFLFLFLPFPLPWILVLLENSSLIMIIGEIYFTNEAELDKTLVRLMDCLIWSFLQMMSLWLVPGAGHGSSWDVLFMYSTPMSYGS